MLQERCHVWRLGLAAISTPPDSVKHIATAVVGEAVPHYDGGDGGAGRWHLAGNLPIDLVPQMDPAAFSLVAVELDLLPRGGGKFEFQILLR